MCIHKKLFRKLIILVFLMTPLVSHALDVTVDGFKKQGIKPLSTEAIKQLIVDKVIIVRNLETLGHYEVRFNKDGTRVLQGVAATKVGGGIEYRPFTADPKAHTAKYEVKDGKLLTIFDDAVFEVRIYQLGTTYYAAHSADKGVVKWELIRH